MITDDGLFGIFNAHKYYYSFFALYCKSTERSNCILISVIYYIVGGDTGIKKRGILAP